MIRPIFLLFYSVLCIQSYAQSFEFMPGTERIFIDVQYLKFFDAEQKFSLFSRARATTEYNAPNTDLFTAGYLNYTSKSGFGGSIIGRISSFNAGIDIGPHFFKGGKSFLIFALPSINIGDELLYSWFSIVRFTPELKNGWKLYTSFELFSAFFSEGHLSSIQRIRLGVDKKGYQFGFAINLAERGRRLQNTDTNPGLFFRKQF